MKIMASAACILACLPMASAAPDAVLLRGVVSRTPPVRLSAAQPPKDIKTIKKALSQCSRTGQWQQALALVDRLSSLREDGPTIKETNAAASACAKAGRSDLTLSLLYNHVGLGGAWDSYSYSLAIAAYGKRGRWKLALQLLEDIEELADCATDSHANNVVIYPPPGMPYDAVPTPMPNEFVYGSAIGACAVAGQWREAMRLLGVIEARGLTLNTRCYNGALSACDRAHQPEAALKLLGRMRASENAQPTVVSYSTVIAACSRVPDMAERAVQLMRLMKSDGVQPNAFTYGALAQAYTATGSWREALRLLREMEKRGVGANELVLTNVLNACAQGGAWKPALAIARTMRTRYGISPDAASLNAAIKACARAEQPQAALEILEGMGGIANERSYGAALSAVARAGMWQQALTLLERMEFQAKVKPNLKCLTAAMAACGAAGEWCEALELWQRVVGDPSLKPDAVLVSTVLDACIRSEQWEPALEVIHHLHSLEPPKVMTPALRAERRAKKAAEKQPIRKLRSYLRAGKRQSLPVELAATPPPPTPDGASERRRNTLLSEVCMQMDGLTRCGALPREGPLTMEAAINAVESWGVGSQVATLLTMVPRPEGEVEGDEDSEALVHT